METADAEILLQLFLHRVQIPVGLQLGGQCVEQIGEKQGRRRRRNGASNSQGMFLTMIGPIICVTGIGNRFQSSIASLNFGLRGLISGSAPPLLSQ